MRSLPILVALLAAPGSVSAGEPETPSRGFWTGVLERLDVKAKPAPMPDFVRGSRLDPGHLTYMPTGPVPRNQSVPVKSPDEIEAAKSALDAAQAAQLKPRIPATRKTKPAKAAASGAKPTAEHD